MITSLYYTKPGPGIGMRNLPRLKARWTVIEEHARNSAGGMYLKKSISYEDAKEIVRTIRQNHKETLSSVAKELGMKGSTLKKVIEDHGLRVPVK